MSAIRYPREHEQRQVQHLEPGKAGAQLSLTGLLL